jgi:hypothetical protein
MDFTTNYCGMYWSDGKIQASVDGQAEPVNELDAACRTHDRDYFYAERRDDLDAADNKFYDTTYNLGLRGKLYGALVKYGNSFLRGRAKMGATYAKGAKDFGQIIDGSYSTPSLRGSEEKGSGGVVTVGVSPDGTLAGLGSTSGANVPIQPDGNGPTAGAGVAGVVYAPNDQQAGSSAGSNGSFLLGIARDPGVLEVLRNERDYDFSAKPSKGGFMPSDLYRPLRKKKFAPLTGKERKKYTKKLGPPGNKIHIDGESSSSQKKEKSNRR